MTSCTVGSLGRKDGNFTCGRGGRPPSVEGYVVDVQMSSQSPIASTRSRSVGGDAEDERASSSVTMRFSRSESELEEMRKTPVDESDAIACAVDRTESRAVVMGSVGIVVAVVSIVDVVVDDRLVGGSGEIRSMEH